MQKKEPKPNVAAVSSETVKEEPLDKLAKMEENKRKTPKTLQNFEKYSKDWYDKNVKGIVSIEDEKIIEKKLKGIIDSSEFSMRFKSQYLDKLLESERFMNQFETKTSGGTVSSHYRKIATQQLFGTENKRFKGFEREKYGYLGNKNFLFDYNFNLKHYSGCSQYGDIIVRFKKNILKDRVTFTVNNSLGPAYKRSLIAGSTNKGSINAIDINTLSDVAKTIKNNEINTVEQLTEMLNVRYIELQYHGEITLKDVSEMCFTGKIPENTEKLKKLGIKLFKIEGGKSVEI